MGINLVVRLACETMAFKPWSLVVEARPVDCVVRVRPLEFLDPSPEVLPRFTIAVSTAMQRSLQKKSATEKIKILLKMCNFCLPAAKARRCIFVH